MDVGKTIVVITACLALGFLIGALCAIGGMEEIAVERGVAEYYLDAEHEKQFRWKTNEVAK